MYRMPVEGMVRVETLGRDYYVFDEERQELRGEHSGETFRLGQRVTVKLTGVHVGRLEIDLEHLKEEEGRRPFRRRHDDRAQKRARFEDKDEQRRGNRRAHDFLTNPPTAIEATTGEVHRRHHISPTGFYRGKKVIATKADE